MATNRSDRTIRLYNLHLIDESSCDDTGMPILASSDVNLEGCLLVNFRATPKGNEGAHFFMEDYAFENTWRDPLKYVPMLKSFAFTLTPDFSCFLEMPEPMQRWNVYRSRAVGRIWQDAGLCVVPTVTWGMENTYQFAFDGIPDNSTVCFSTVGLMRCKEGKKLFRDGAEAACEYLHPSKIICYGNACDFNAQGAEVVWVKSEMEKRFEKIREVKNNG